MKVTDVLRAWSHIARGESPSLSIEITRECPLRCPGCYAYEDGHLGAAGNLRQLTDRKGTALVEGVLEVVDRLHPLHLSIVGGDPLVRYRELEVLLPQLLARRIHVQVVTSAFRPLPKIWAEWAHFTTVVSIDGLQPEHDARRKPATYARILDNIAGARIIVHCTITAQMMQRAGYLDDFLQFWTPKPEITKVWFSIFTPQRGQVVPEMLSAHQRQQAIRTLFELRCRYPKLDMPKGMIEEFNHPPAGPEHCIFARTTRIISADLSTVVTPCQFGGDPDCSQCGCVASMGLAAVGSYRLGGLLPTGSIFWASAKIGSFIARHRGATETSPPSPFPLINQPFQGLPLRSRDLER